MEFIKNIKNMEGKMIIIKTNGSKVGLMGGIQHDNDSNEYSMSYISINNKVLNVGDIFKQGQFEFEVLKCYPEFETIEPSFFSLNRKSTIIFSLKVTKKEIYNGL